MTVLHEKYGVTIADYAVPESGQADASEGIQAALDSGAPRIYVPFGVYRLDRGLLIPGNTELRVHPEARLFLADGAGRHATDFLLSNRNPEKGDVDIAVCGGIWDGNNRNNPRGREGDMDAYTGTMINMKNVRGLELRDMRLKDSTAYFTRFTRVRDFRVERIEFQITHITRNQDGIHCAGYCEDGEIHDIAGHGVYTTADDLVALNADDALLRSELLGAEAGPIRRLHISNLRADDCHSFVRMASIWAEISDIDIRGVFGGCRKMVLNADALRYCRVPLFDSQDPAYAHGVGMLRNIRFADAQVHKTGSDTTPLFCLESRLDHVRLVNIRRNMARDACPEAALLAIRNVQQGRLRAECRARDLAPEPDLSTWQQVVGHEQHVRQEARATIDAFVIPDSEHIIDLVAGDPVVHDLPPANNRVGLLI